MKKWRPGHKCLYVIPEIKGNINSLEVILNRILPLRKFSGQEDDLIFLGGYIDGFEHGHKVLDILITIRAEYGERVVCLIGSSEHRFLRAILGNEREYRDWISCGGTKTIEGYLNRAGIKSDAGVFPQNRLKDIVPNNHIEFLQSLQYSHIKDGYLFIYGGLNWKLPISNNNAISFALDTSFYKFYKCLYKEGREIDVEKVVIAAYTDGGMPVAYPKYMALGMGAPKSLLCADLNSMQFVRAKNGKSRIYPVEIKIYE